MLWAKTNYNWQNNNNNNNDNNNNNNTVSFVT